MLGIVGEVCMLRIVGKVCVLWEEVVQALIGEFTEDEDEASSWDLFIFLVV